MTEDGKRLLKNLPEHLDLKYVRSLPAYEQSQDNSRAPVADEGLSSSDAVSEATPEDLVQIAFQRLEGELQADLLARVRQAHPSFLEQVIVDLLIGMGYGGGDAARGEVLGQSGDGGIDGTINEDVLGLLDFFDEFLVAHQPQGKPRAYHLSFVHVHVSALVQFSGFR